MKVKTQYKEIVPIRQLCDDVRVKELLHALNERILPKEIVTHKLARIAGFPIRFYRYRDGTYYICD